jgi:hypothetical protein
MNQVILNFKNVEVDHYKSIEDGSLLYHLFRLSINCYIRVVFGQYLNDLDKALIGMVVKIVEKIVKFLSKIIDLPKIRD